MPKYIGKAKLIELSLQLIHKLREIFPLLHFIFGSIHPENRPELRIGHGCASAVDQVGQQLLHLCATERDRLSVIKHLKLPETLDEKSLAWTTDRMAQVQQRFFDLLRTRGLQDIVADVELQCIQSVARIRRHHDHVDERMDPLHLRCQGQSVHIRHFDIQKRNVDHLLFAEGKRGSGIPGGKDLILRRHCRLHDSVQIPQCARLIIHKQNVHCHPPLTVEHLR